MKKTYKESIKQWLIEADEGCVLHLEGSDDYRSRRASVTDPEKWEEIPEDDVPAYTESQYKERVEALIRERYTVADELAVLRQRDAKPEEFAAYNAFAEQCKASAKVQLTAGEEAAPEE